MTKALITPPAALPVTLQQIKTHCRIETADEDDLLLDLAAAATAHVEARTGLALIEQVWRVYAEAVPASRELPLPVSPVSAVDEIRVYDAFGTPTILAPGDYELLVASDPPTLRFAVTLDPSLSANGVECDVVAGYGQTGPDVPAPLTRAILVLVSLWHAARGSALDASQLGIEPQGFARLLAPFMRVRL